MYVIIHNLASYSFIKTFIKMNFKLPLVVILGATGSGKTKLSIDLAKRFGGEIIGADSMQIYKGLDILSAKPTAEERQQAPHNLVDILDPKEICTVVDYRNRALPIIDKLLTENKLPIVVGGTNYYIESILWKILLDKPGADYQVSPYCTNNYLLPSEELHEKLKLVDPIMAQRLHPNNKRKILRALEVLGQKGIKMSDLLHEQQSNDGGNPWGGGLRYSKVVVFNLHWDKQILEKRMFDRVDVMVKEGLKNELLHFHKQYNQPLVEKGEQEYNKGIYQIIGLRDFHDYLILKDDERNTEDAETLFNKCLDRMKVVTRQYAMRQYRWMNQRLLADNGREVPPVFKLDVTDVSKWDEIITKPAIQIVDSVINGTDCAYSPMERLNRTAYPMSQDQSHKCDICKRTFVGDFQWKLHLSSNRHKRQIAREAKMKTNEDNKITGVS